MRRTDYSTLAGHYDKRYAQRDYPGVAGAVRGFVGESACDVLEVGCGTGHWVGLASELGHRVHGLDASQAMLDKARGSHRDADLRLGSAECLPWPDASMDRVFCVHALHHFPDREGFLCEARRVLRPGGALMVIGLDPRRPDLRWAIYDYWEPTRALDLARYPDFDALAAMMGEAGFPSPHTRCVEVLEETADAAEALRDGRFEAHTTSQLAILTAAEYARGRQRLEQAIETARADGAGPLRLSTPIELWAASAAVAPG